MTEWFDEQGNLKPIQGESPIPAVIAFMLANPAVLQGAISGAVALVNLAVDLLGASPQTTEEQKAHLDALKARLDETNAAVQAYRPRTV